ncbi:MAG: carotenoid oxygenase family protein [Polyangiaceae bacterium]
MLSRRRFLHLAGLSGLPLLGVPWLSGCADPESTDPGETSTKVPLPDDPDKAWWLRQNFAPVEESEASELTIVGALPPSLTGLYLRNGPNPMSGESGHWFLGDGMVHGVRLTGGKAPWYRARYIQTEILGMSEEGGAGPPGLTAHGANTAVVHHANRLLCLEEVGVPYEISAKDLATIGPYDFGGVLTTAMTAHPKIDPITGEMFFFGYGLLDSSIHYRRTDAKGAIVASESIKVPKGVMMHDFQVTEVYVVLMDLPILFDLAAAIDGAAFPFKWAPENGARIGLMPRYGTADQVKWFEIDPCFVFHTWNASHDFAKPEVVYLDCIRYETMWEDRPGSFSAKGAPVRFTIDTIQETVSVSAFDDRNLEFPRVSAARRGCTVPVRVLDRGNRGASIGAN